MLGVVHCGMSNSDKTTRASDLKTVYTPVFSKPNYVIQIMTYNYVGLLRCQSLLTKVGSSERCWL